MQLHELVTEDHMVAAFLRAEIESPRYREHFPQQPVWRAIRDRRLILKPNLDDEAENAIRRKLLSYRGYGWDGVLFAGLPADVVWHRVRLTIGELGAAKYAKHGTWITLSGQTRLIADGAKNVGKVSPPLDPTKHILAIAALLKDGHSFPELIFLGEPKAPVDDLVLLRGIPVQLPTSTHSTSPCWLLRR